MDKLKAIFKSARPYQEDKMNLPVEDVEKAIPFYESMLGFKVLSRNDAPHKTVVLSRDEIQFGLAENGGDPSQDGCFFEVDNLETALAELNANGLQKKASDVRIDKYGETSWKVFFIIAPDGLCYCLGERQS
jgi:lactoylglutathione lyase